MLAIEFIKISIFSPYFTMEMSKPRSNTITNSVLISIFASCIFHRAFHVETMKRTRIEGETRAMNVIKGREKINPSQAYFGGGNRRYASEI